MPSPLVSLTAAEATQNRKTNPFAGWGDRGSPNRVEPIAKPEFEVPFRMEPGQKVFTIGSCFARNVEGELQKRGFNLPVRELFRTPAFEGVDLGIINNYGTPSIYNEIAWAFDEEPYRPEEHLLEVMPGKFADIHLSPARKPEPWDVVLSRRQSIREAYRLAAECNVTIMTLGLAELWFDTKTGYYLNVAPRPGMTRDEPNRFQLHALSYGDAYGYLERALGILHRHAPEMKIILTVSPVPLMATHRPMDVLVANTYSKSLLRAVAEEAVTRHDFVTYFPSYESFLLTDRKLAWKDDLIHTNDDLVSLNVGRMIAAFVGGDAPEASSSMERAAALVEADPQGALELLEGQGDPAAAPLRAKALIALGRAREAYDSLDTLCAPGLKSPGLWSALLDAALAVGDPALIHGAALRMGNSMPFRASPAYLAAAKWFRAHGEPARALEMARKGAVNANSAGVIMDLAELLSELGQRQEGAELMGKLSKEQAAQPRAKRILERVEA
ncbi:MAG TPA: GSCFA domain-containing protein [Caulobacteraceae bacterium]